jgi:spermidine synthase
MPSLVRPAASSILVVGLGGGVALEAVPSRVESIEVVELEPEVVAANRAIAAQRQRDPLSDPRVRLVLNDARSALLLSDERYDAIVSQPSHPWTAGASHLFTREFFELARDHLSPGGILVQWMGLAFLDESLLRSLLATLVEVFPHVSMYSPTGGALLFLASEQPLAVETNTARAIAAAPEEFATLGVYRPEDVAALALLDEAGTRAVSAGAPLNTDDRNLLRMRSLALARAARPNFRATELVGPFYPLARATPEYDRAYLVRRLLARRLPGRAQQVAASTEDPVQRATASGMLAMTAGRPRAAQREIASALELDPAAAEARAALLQLNRRAIAAGVDPTLPGNPRELESALIAGWRAEAVGDWSAVEALDPRLARSIAEQPLFADAVRLRVAWRLAEAGSPRVREAVALSDQLVHATGSPRDLVLRARAVAAAGDGAGALTTLFQALAASRPVPEDRAAARGALKLLSSLAPDVGNPPQRARLEAALRGALP